MFQDVESLAATCRFADCRHQSEPGCAVKRALDDGSLSPGRHENYLKLRRELGAHGRWRDRLRASQHLHHRPQHDEREREHEQRAEHLPTDVPDLRVLSDRRRGRSRNRGHLLERRIDERDRVAAHFVETDGLFDERRQRRARGGLRRSRRR